MAFLIVIKLLILGLQMMSVKQKLNKKAIIASWSGVFIFCIINLLNKWLGLGTSDTSPYLPSSVATILKENVELQVLLMLFITYGLFYLYYRRKLSA